MVFILYIDLDNLKYNIEKLNEMYTIDYAILKSNAYNAKIKNIFYILNENGIKNYAVFYMYEALMIRSLCNSCHILLLGKFEYVFINIYKLYDITLSVNSLTDYHLVINNNLKFEIKINTGMNRFGISVSEFLNIKEEVIKNKNCIGIYSHLSDNSESNFTKIQINNFNKAVSGITNKQLHLNNSDNIGTNKYLNRVGIAMYNQINLKNVFYYKKRISDIRYLKAGEIVGYNSQNILKEDTYVGIINIGYTNGFINLFKDMEVFINNNYYKIIFDICMNVMFIKVDKTVKINDVVELLGDNITLDYVSKHTGLKKYEILLIIK